jgi:hypothetical protein
MKPLRQSTAVTPKVGPFVSTTDGATASTALTIAQADCILFLNQGAGAQKNSATSATHDTQGVYGVPFNATDTGTLGHLKLVINKSGAFPVWDEWIVIPANVYDSLVAGTADLNINIHSIAGVATNATSFGAATSTMAILTVDNTSFTATTTELETSSITTAAANHWVGRNIIFTSGTLLQQATTINAYVLSAGGRGHFTYTAVTSAPANGVTAVIV